MPKCRFAGPWPILGHLSRWNLQPLTFPHFFLLKLLQCEFCGSGPDRAAEALGHASQQSAWPGGQGSPRTSQQEAETFGRAPIAGAGWAFQAGCKGCTAKASKTDSRACRAFSARRARPTTASSRSCEAACATRTCCEWLQWRWGAEGTSTSVAERFCTGSRPVVCL